LPIARTGALPQRGEESQTVSRDDLTGILGMDLEHCQECGDDMTLTGGYIVEDNGCVGRVERE
jgi:hypothetical protein